MRITPVTFWRSQEKLSQQIGVVGTIVSYSLIAVPPRGFTMSAPYYIALIALADKTRLTAQIIETPGKTVKTGSKVIGVMRKLHPQSVEDIIPYIIKFKLQ